MSTTTIRLDDELKARVGATAARTGQTAHAFILEAIARSVDEAEAAQAFEALAAKRWAKYAKTGDSVGWDEAKTYLQARARGEPAIKPAKAAKRPV
jgi:predicted transcriptional regulator